MLRSVTRRLAPTLRRSISYKTNLQEKSFLLHDVLKISNHYTKIGYPDCNQELIDSLVSECSKFCEQELAPLYAKGDEEGCVLNQETHTVTTPSGWKEAYQVFKKAGWMGLTVASNYGGQGLPISMGVVRSDLLGTANWAWSMYPGLTMGAMNTLLAHGSEDQKQTYVRKMAEGEWLGTMCLTEPHCGSDLGQVKTQAVKQEDGSYKLNGTKIFISCGDHDWTDNILHVVLARIPGAPEGTKGISLFLVPKYLTKKGTGGQEIDYDRGLNVTCGGLEKKMGIHGSSTCVINFDNSIGYLIGEPNTGLQQMFTFMNTARLGTALQGVNTAELSYQNSRVYAKERLAFRSIEEPKYPKKPADPLIVHPDVRRMLLFQRSIAEGGRAMVYYSAMLADSLFLPEVDGKFMLTESERQRNIKVLGFLTPIIKGFLTELGVESSNMGIQVWGGHGYIKENGVEQIFRDARISTIYEGTTGIQGLDLLGRKVMLQGGRPVTAYLLEVGRDCRHIILGSQRGALSWQVYEILKAVGHWQWLTTRLMVRARQSKEVVGVASTDYLMYSGYVVLAHWWLKMSEVAAKKLTEPNLSPEHRKFYETKLQTAQFYYEHVFPRRHWHAKSMMGSVKSLMQIDEDAF